MGFANIIFDFDGTLADSRRDIAGAQLWVLRQFGVNDHTLEDLTPMIGRSLADTFARFLPPALHGRIPEAKELYAEYYRPRALATTTLFPGVAETLDQLVRGGKRLAVASTKRGPGIKRAADHFGITARFVQLQGSEGMPVKPDPAILNKVMADQGWERTETLMVGDTDMDILAGRNAGVAICAVTYGSLREEELRRLSPDFVIGRFPDLLAIVNHR